jgi:hypothetical protein
MRIYKRYRCDHGHEWTVQTVNGAVDEIDDTYCPLGHIAITCNLETPSDEVQVLLRPAARIVDRITGSEWGKGRYFIVLLDCNDQEIGVSHNHFSWDEVLKLASLFKGKDKKSAMEWWKRKKL